MPAQLTQPAMEDLHAIIRGAALRSRSRATALLADFQGAFEQVGNHPGSGEAWRGATKGLRFKRVRPGWLVFYREVPTGQMVDIVRIASRDSVIKWANADLEDALAEIL